jgi:hypothetical protein
MQPSEIRDKFFGHGHRNVIASHKTTLEFTKDSHLSRKGTCIVTVGTNKALTDLRAELKETLRNPSAKLRILIEVDHLAEEINAFGSPQLILDHPKDMVIRKSDYVCNRTLAIRADKAAQDLSRELVEKLLNPEQKVKITLTAHI